MPLQTGWDIGREFVIGRIIPLTEVLYKFMLLRILVELYNKTNEIGFSLPRDSLEGTFK